MACVFLISFTGRLFREFHAPSHTESVPDNRTVFSGPPFLFGKVPKCFPWNSSSQHVLRNGNAIFPKPECCDRPLSIYYIVVDYQPSCSVYKPRERTGFPFPGVLSIRQPRCRERSHSRLRSQLFFFLADATSILNFHSPTISDLEIV